ncbi:MAG: tetratricopeptide repeat protein [Pseudomonadota bacterium]
MDSATVAPSSAQSENQAREIDGRLPSALQDAEEFTDVFLDDSFIEIERRLLSLRHRKKPALVQAVTRGQIIGLKNLLPELHVSGVNSPNDEGIQAARETSDLTDTAWMGELNNLDYDDLYAEIESDALADSEEAVSRMLKSLSNRNPEKTTQQFVHNAAKQNVDEELGLKELPVPDVMFTEMELQPKIEELVEEVAESDQNFAANQRCVFMPADDVELETTDDIEFETTSEAVKDAIDADDIDEVTLVSRIEPEPVANALQISGEVPHIDPQKIAQALVDMYMENERVLAEQREAQHAAQAVQRRQLVLISAGAVCAVLIAATIVYLLLSANMRALSVPEVSVPTLSNVPPPRYLTVNEVISGSVVGTEPSESEMASLASKEASTLADNSIAEAVDAGSVGADEFNYYDESIYEPDAMADAENTYYPVAEAEYGITFDQRVADTSPHEQAYAQWTDGDLAGARSAYERILKANPEDTEALVGLGSMAQQQGNQDMAVGYLVRAVKNKPDHAFALAALASMSSTNNRIQLENDLMQLARSNPLISELPFILGNWYARDKRWADAQQAYFDAFNRDSQSADYAFNLAVSLDQLGKTSSAKSFYQKAISLAPSSITHFDVEQARARVATLN